MVITGGGEESRVGPTCLCTNGSHHLDVFVAQVTEWPLITHHMKGLTRTRGKGKTRGRVGGWWLITNAFLHTSFSSLHQSFLPLIFFTLLLCPIFLPSLFISYLHKSFPVFLSLPIFLFIFLSSLQDVRKHSLGKKNRYPLTDIACGEAIRHDVFLLHFTMGVKKGTAFALLFCLHLLVAGGQEWGLTAAKRINLKCVI